MICSPHLVQDFIDKSKAHVSNSKSVFSAYTLMTDLNVDTLLVLDENNCVEGIIKLNSIVDLLKEFKSDLEKLKQIKVGYLCKSDKICAHICVYPNMNLADAYSTMKYLELKKLAVVESVVNKKFLGILRFEDIKNLSGNCLSN